MRHKYKHRNRKIVCQNFFFFKEKYVKKLKLNQTQRFLKARKIINQIYFNMSRI